MDSLWGENKRHIIKAEFIWKGTVSWLIAYIKIYCSMVRGNIKSYARIPYHLILIMNDTQLANNVKNVRLQTIIIYAVVAIIIS